MKMKLLLAVLVFGLICGTMFFPHEAEALGPFGGQIIALIPCVFPFGGYVIQLGPPSFGSYLYQAGLSFSYMYGPPTHPGQWLLGMSGAGLECATDFSHGNPTDWMSGGVILYHGSSM